MILKSHSVLVVLTLLINVGSFSQQSSTGSQPPPNMDQGIDSKSTNVQVIIAGVPAYNWTRGCGPTALGMVIGYYDSNGFPDLIEGDATIQTTEVNNTMANDSHYNDYSSPLDYYPNMIDDNSEIGGAHPSNCIADFMKTSWSSNGNYWGWSWFSHVGVAFNSYITYQNTQYLPIHQNVYYSSAAWESYKNEIDNQRPVVVLVDTDGNGSSDHFVTGIGYDDVTNKYAVYHTWDTQIHWYTFQGMSNAYSWGIYGFTKFSITNNTATLTEYKEDIKIYPNPSKNIFYIDPVYESDRVKIEIFNSLGQKIREIQDTEIDLTNEEDGVYSLRFYTENTINTIKIIKN